MIFIQTNWKNLIDEYNSKQNIKFDEFVNNERIKYHSTLDIYPPSSNIFNCFKYFNIEDTKVVIIGQDPYHGPNQATGLCFDIGEKCKYPPSLRNISKCLGKEPDFNSWAKQGVLLLNSSLTVVQGNPGSHIKYWLPFTKFIIERLLKINPDVTFIIWGAFALKLVENLNITNIYISSHPSPLSCNKQLKNYPSFFDSNVFKKINSISW
tara:strand:+ start:46 stop:672 length:627 start_codon:yes stop_codon:yes gene_type:complete